MNYILHLIVIIGIYIPLAYSLNLMIGYGGFISFCHAAFYGIGAYVYALLIIKMHLPPLLSLLSVLPIAAIIAGTIGMVCLRFRDDLFIFVSLSFQMIIFALLYNWTELTNGPYGIAGIPRPEILGFMLRSPLHYAVLIIFLDVIVLIFLFVLEHSPFGIVLKALRDNERAAEALGINPKRIYIQTFIIAAVFAAISGVLYATYVTYIDPTSFTLAESIFQVSILLLGGSGSHRGPIIGVLIMLMLPELLRFIGFPEAIAHNMREIIYGLLLILFMYFRPQGIAGGYKVAQK
jgi:branched-chain amino acid transport system permease protein